MSLLSLTFIALGIITPDIHDDPQAPLHQLQYFQGLWRAQDSNGALGPEARVNLHVHRVAGGSWYAFSWIARHDGHDHEGVSLAGYDASRAQFVEHDVNSSSTYGDSTSPGWVDDAFVWTGVIHNWHGHRVHLRKTYQRVDAGHLQLTVECSDDGQDWQSVGQFSFTR